MKKRILSFAIAIIMLLGCSGGAVFADSSFHLDETFDLPVEFEIYETWRQEEMTLKDFSDKYHIVTGVSKQFNLNLNVEKFMVYYCTTPATIEIYDGMLNEFHVFYDEGVNPETALGGDNWTDDDEDYGKVLSFGTARYIYDPGIYMLVSKLGGVYGTPIILEVCDEEDVPEMPSDWAFDEVMAAIDRELVPSHLQGSYTQPATRAEFCALAVTLYETLTKQEITERKTFTDTDDENVEKMGAIGIVNGVSADKFDPDGQLNREQAAAILSRLAASIGDPFKAAAPTFADNEKISSWAAESVGVVQAAGIMGGVGNNTFNPTGTYTREQCILTIMRMFNKLRADA